MISSRRLTSVRLRFCGGFCMSEKLKGSLEKQSQRLFCTGFTVALLLVGSWVALLFVRKAAKPKHGHTGRPRHSAGLARKITAWFFPVAPSVTPSGRKIRAWFFPVTPSGRKIRAGYFPDTIRARDKGLAGKKKRLGQPRFVKKEHDPTPPHHILPHILPHHSAPPTNEAI